MPNMTNITVKKADGTTDITYTGKSPSAGFGSSALFRADSVGTSVAARPSLTVTPVQRSNRLVAKVNFVFPIVDSSTGKVVDYGTIKGESNFPTTATDSEVAEGVAQGTHLIASQLIKGVMREGNGPN